MVGGGGGGGGLPIIITITNTILLFTSLHYLLHMYIM